MRDNATMVLGIGAPRAGTTWLATYLGNHPQFSMSPIKELHYFDAKYLPGCCGYFDEVYAHVLMTLEPDDANIDHVRRRVHMRSNADYLDYFRQFVRDERCFGEISPAYCLLPGPAIREIVALLPNVRFVFLLRDPVDRFLSNAFYMANALDISFRDPNPYIRSTLHSDHLLIRADYRRTIETYDRAAPGAILYLFYERLFGDASIRRLCDFCGLDFRPGDYGNRINRSKSSEATRVSPDTRRLVYQCLADQYAFAADYFGPALPANWRADMARYV